MLCQKICRSIWETNKLTQAKYKSWGKNNKAKIRLDLSQNDRVIKIKKIDLNQIKNIGKR